MVAHLATLPDLLTYGQKGASLTLLGYAGAHYVADIWERSHHTALLLEKVFHPDHLNEMARRTGFVQRQRHFDVPCYVAAWWVIHFDNLNGYNKRFASLYDAYRDLVIAKSGKNEQEPDIISKSAFYQQLQKPEAARFASMLLSEVMTANILQYPAEALGGINAYFQQTFNVCVGNGASLRLDVSDGSVLGVVPRAANNMDCKASGRQKQPRANTGGEREPQPEAASTKLHVGMDSTSGAPYYYYLGSGVSNELAPIQVMAIPDLLSVHDRAADSKEHRRFMSAENGNYLYRMTNHHVYKVVQAKDGLTGEDLTLHLKGKKLKEIRDMENAYTLLDLAVSVPLAGNQEVTERVIMCQGLDDENGKHTYQVLATNLTAEKLPAVVAPFVYGLRWYVENETFRNAKSTCALSCINSGNASIITQCFCFSLIVFGCKRNLWAATQSTLYADAKDPDVQAFKADPEAAIRNIVAAVEDPDITSVQLPPSISLEKVCRSRDPRIKEYFLGIIAGRGRKYLWQLRTNLINDWIGRKLMHSDARITGRKLKRCKLFQVKMSVIIAKLLDARPPDPARPSS